MAALLVYQELTGVLHESAPTIHQLVRERIAMLDEAYGQFNHPTETRTEHAERVLALGQHPFPLGECIYDDLNVNTGYEHVEVGYGLPEDGDLRITFTGWYPHWAPDGESFEHRTASIHCPSWLVTDADGEQRFRDQTDAMVAAVKAERERESAAINALLEQLRLRGDDR
jgi:hypothetical protein